MVIPIGFNSLVTKPTVCLSTARARSGLDRSRASGNRAASRMRCTQTSWSCGNGSCASSSSRIANTLDSQRESSAICATRPVRTQKELISPSWHRYEAITHFAPELIVIHYSGFKQEDASGPRPQLKLLIEYFLRTDTRFLIYSRASDTWLDNKMDLLLEDLRADNPDLDARIDIFPLLEYGEPNWMDQTSAQAVKLKIKDILELE